jgi:hypothetical protein
VAKELEKVMKDLVEKRYLMVGNNCREREDENFR